MLLIYILISSFQSLLLESRPMTLHHVTYHVTTVTCLFIIQKKKKKKRNIKLEKIDKKKRKMFMSKHTITLISKLATKLQEAYYFTKLDVY